MLILTTITTTVSDSLADMFSMSIGRAAAKPRRRRSVRDAYERFAIDNEMWTESLFDLHFLHGRGDAVIADYLDGLLTRHQAAVDLADAWQAQLPSANTVRRQRLHAVGTFAAARFLAYLPEQ